MSGQVPARKPSQPKVKGNLFEPAVEDSESQRSESYKNAMLKTASEGRFGSSSLINIDS